MNANATVDAIKRAKYASLYCKAGHKFTPANTLWWAGGDRRCRTCTAVLSQRKAEKKKAAKLAASQVLELPHLEAPRHDTDAIVATLQAQNAQLQAQLKNAYAVVRALQAASEDTCTALGRLVYIVRTAAGRIPLDKEAAV